MPRLTNSGEPLTEEEKEAVRDGLDVIDFNNVTPTQGREAIGLSDDDGKIPGELMPNEIEVDSIQVGEAPTSILPEGTITRVGTDLYVHDNSTEGGILVGASGDIPIARIAGTCTIYDSANGSFRGKIGTGGFCAVELGRVSIPAGVFAAGKRLCVTGYLRAHDSTTTFGLNKKICIFSAARYDTQLSGTGWTSNAFPGFTFGSGSQQELLSRINVSYNLTNSSGSVAMTATSPSEYGRGEDWTSGSLVATQLTTLHTVSTLDFTIGAASDLVIAYTRPTSNTSTLTVNFDLSVSIIDP